MSDADIADPFGLPLPFVAAIRAVESAGNPNAVRFEPHVFRRFRPDTVRVLQRGALDIERQAAWNAGAIPYTPGLERAASPIRVETDRAAFERARRIDAEAAVRSTSWGAFQVMGQHLLELHAGDTRRAVDAFDADPINESDRLLVSWLRVNPKAVAAAKAGDVAKWVWRYNGSTGAAAEKYIRRFRAELAKARWPADG